MGSSDRMTRLWSVSDSSSARELLTISGHSGNIDRVRFHPTQDFLLATTSSGDGKVLLWDIRGSSHKSAGKIDLATNTSTGPGKGAADISWSPKPGILCVTDRSGEIYVLDTRKLASNQSWSSSSIKTNRKKSNNSPLLKSFSLRPSFVDACIFSPSSHHLVAATSNDGYGEITTWNWEEGTSNAEENNNLDGSRPPKFVYPAHTGPIYSMSVSPDGKHLATGSGDALVGLWDVNSMVCTSTITRCGRFIRSVSFSHDSQLLATSTEDDVLDVAMADSGDLVGQVSLSGNRGRAGGGPCGADEIAFHPKAHLLACSRCDSVVNAPLAIVKLKVERA